MRKVKVYIENFVRGIGSCKCITLNANGAAVCIPSYHPFNIADDAKQVPKMSLR